MNHWKRWGYLFLGLLLTLGLAIARPNIQSVWGQPVGFDSADGAPEDYGGFPGVPLSQPFEAIAETAEELPGLFTLYRNQAENSLYLAIHPDQLEKNFLCVTTLSSGLGEIFYRGWSLNDFLFQFHKVNDTIQLVVPNIYFRAEDDDPQRRSIERSFSDSIIASIPIASTNPDDGSMLIDLNHLLLYGQDLSDLSTQIAFFFNGLYAPSPDTSSITTVGAFPENVELDVMYTFSGSNIPFFLSSLPSNQGFNLDVHYSFSELPTDNGYRPRQADERVGYQISAYQDLSSLNQRDSFVRHIWRWKLEKQNPDLDLSPPKEPIVFWIENTVPLEYRESIREGVLLWNDAFREAGFENAVDVRQMPDDADWDPADIRYNTIRWSNSLYPWAIGIASAHTNPLTGQILDADVVLDANGIRSMLDGSGFLAQQHPTSSPEALAQASQFQLNPLLCQRQLGESYLRWMTQQTNPSQSTTSILNRQQHLRDGILGDDTCYGMGMMSQGTIGALTLSTLQNALPSGDAMGTFIHQFLVNLTAHEIGHALGLRHNFRASTMLAPEELNDLAITRTKGLSGSVMDYTPVNLAPVGQPQGDYFSLALGPYDKWAIAYGYTPTNASFPIEEQRELEPILSRATEPNLAYSPDEDAFDMLNLGANAWDLSNDPMQYAQWQMDNAKALWSKLSNRYPLPGESFSELRDRFDVVLSHYFEQVFKVERYIGGQNFNRDRPGNPGARQPFEPVPIQKQREALSVLSDYLFAPNAFDFPPELLSNLAPSRWWHWGATPPLFRLDYPAYENILSMQSIALSSLLSSERLNRIRDAELTYAPGETLSMPELFGTLHHDIWVEVIDPADENASITSLRRELQRQYLSLLSNMALRNTNAINEATNFLDVFIAFITMNVPEDARTLARYQLRQLYDEIGRTLRRHDDDMDTLTLAHLEDAQDRIAKIIDAPLRSQ